MTNCGNDDGTLVNYARGTLPDEARKAEVLRLFLSGEDVNHIIFLCYYILDAGQICDVLRDEMRRLRELKMMTDEVLNARLTAAMASDNGNYVLSKAEITALLEEVRDRRVAVVATGTPYKLYVWRKQPSYVVMAHAQNVTRARELAFEDNMGESSDGSCPEREAACLAVKTTQPEIHYRESAEFVLTDSALLREEEAETAELRALLGRTLRLLYTPPINAEHSRDIWNEEFKKAATEARRHGVKARGEGMSERSFTQRGFENFCEFIDSHDNRIVARESSQIGEPCIWVFCGPAGLNSLSPHLNKTQARLLAEALMRFVDRQEGE